LAAKYKDMMKNQILAAIIVIIDEKFGWFQQDDARPQFDMNFRNYLSSFFF